ncbi:MAG: ATP-binding cassette domain-containing protein, partial [Bacillota bacterium]|nr:ATP-binding cassette domain-containing protein [Bacillota bacterium]
MLTLSNINKSFDAKPILQDINLQVNKGEVFGFLGPNGAGKTTTIRIILGLIFPDKGEVTIDGHDIKRSFNKAIASVGAVVETPRFYDQLNGYQNLLLIANLHPHIAKGR